MVHYDSKLWGRRLVGQRLPEGGGDREEQSCSGKGSGGIKRAEMRRGKGSGGNKESGDEERCKGASLFVAKL